MKSDTHDINEGNTLKDSHVAEYGVGVEFRGDGAGKMEL